MTFTLYLLTLLPSLAAAAAATTFNFLFKQTVFRELPTAYRLDMFVSCQQQRLNNKASC